MKILVLNGSPKKNSDTMHITRAFLQGLDSACENETEIIDVINKDVKPCVGCLACMSGNEVRCMVHNDDMTEILEKIAFSDIIIWSFPLYCYAMPSHLKAVCDRLLPFNKIKMKHEGDRVQHVDKEHGGARRFVMISGSGFPSFKDNFEPARLQFKNCFGDASTIICVSESPLFNVPDAAPLTVPFLEKVKAAGAKYAADGRLDKNTVDALETPMIPPKTYVDIVNANHA